MKHLPNEMLSQVLGCLPREDRLNSALTCRRWAETVETSPLLNDVRLAIQGHELSSAAHVLIESQRKYRNLQLFKAELIEYDCDFWAKIAPNLTELELIECQWTPEVFFLILSQCCKLESLRISSSGFGAEGRSISMADLAFPEGVSLGRIRQALRHVVRLNLHMYLSDRTLFRILSLAPNVTSLLVSSPTRATDASDLLPIILGTNHKITRLDISGLRVHHEDLIELINQSSQNLEELRFGSYEVTGDLQAAASDENNNSLIEDGDVRVIELKKRRKLSLQFCSDNSPKSLSGLAKISTLWHLDLSATGCDSDVLRSIARLANLRGLSLECADLNTEGFDIICESFKSLETLKLGRSGKLDETDGKKFGLLKELKSLDLSGVFGFTDLAFENGLGPPELTSLRVDGCPITDTGLSYIAVNHAHLKDFTMSRCPGITDAGLVALFERNPGLETVKIQECANVSGAFLKALEKLCPQLDSVDTSGCKIPLQALEGFRARRPLVDA